MTLKCRKASLIASTLYSGAGLYGCFNFSTALGATYIGRPKLLFTSAMYAVCILKPYFSFTYSCISLYVTRSGCIFRSSYSIFTLIKSSALLWDNKTHVSTWVELMKLMSAGCNVIHNMDLMRFDTNEN